jgi:roadblock/LC7 domain-containing protein
MTKNNTQGFAILFSVLIVGAVGLFVASSLLLLGVDTHRTSFSVIQSSQALGLADACAEEALEQIFENNAYTETGNLTLSTGSRSYTITNTGGSTRSITTTGTVGTIVRKTTLTVTSILPTITVSTWQETP